MLCKIKDKKGVALLVWIMAIAVIAVALFILIPVLVDVDGSRAKKEDEAHEQTCWDSAYLEWVAGGSFEAVYDFHDKEFVKLTEHPYQVQAYGSTKDHQDCVILVNCDSAGNIKMTWISRQTLRERYR